MIPLDWDHPEGKSIQYFLKRIPAKTQPARGQLWVLQGGPGFEGATIEFLGSIFSRDVDDLDVIIPDHRGTGDSTKLDCPSLDPLLQTLVVDPAMAKTAEDQCVVKLQKDWGDDLHFFSATAAARDVGELSARLAKPGDQTFVYGASYGTRWAHRYLQQFPTQAAGVIFDSIVPEDVSWFDSDAELANVGKAILDACGQDAFCSGKLGPDPFGKLQAVMKKLDTPGTCATSKNISRDSYRAILGNLLLTDFSPRTVLPAAVYRLDRCDAGDQAVFEHLFDYFNAGNQGALSVISIALHLNVVFSELVKTPLPTLSDLQTADAALAMSLGAWSSYRPGYDAWNRYPADAFLGAYVATKTPVLMMNGTLDAQTFVGGAQAFGAHYAGPNQTFVTLERASHGVITNSPIDNSGAQCGEQLASKFLHDPTSAVDATCATAVLPLDFEHKLETWPGLNVSIWENVPPIAKVKVPKLSPSFRLRAGQGGAR